MFQIIVCADCGCIDLCLKGRTVDFMLFCAGVECRGLCLGIVCFAWAALGNLWSLRSVCCDEGLCMFWLCCCVCGYIDLSLWVFWEICKVDS